MSERIAFPSPILAPYIKQYWTIQTTLPGEVPYTFRTIPSGLTEFMFYFGGKPKINNSSKSIDSNFIVSGHQKQFEDLIIDSEMTIFSIVFHPQGLMRFLQLPLNELFNQHVSLAQVAPKLCSELLPRLTDAKSFQARVALVEHFLIQQLRHHTTTPNFPRISHVIKQILHKQGQVSIDELAHEACFSRRQFERVFSELIGQSPKQYLKTVRLQQTLHLKKQNQHLSIADLAFIGGYYDQAHLTNEFKLLTGLTPKQYFTSCSPFSDLFS